MGIIQRNWMARDFRLTETFTGAVSERNSPPTPPVSRRQRWLAVAWQRLVGIGRTHPRTLRLCESLSLGERRFVAVIEYGHSRFLLGGTSSSLVLLSRLESVDASCSGCEPEVPRPEGENR